MKSSKSEFLWHIWTFLLLAAGYLLFLGKAPLFLEEPRRAIITLEMLKSHQYWALTQLGEWYYYKPPMYNWIQAPFALLGTGFQEFFLRLPTVLATFIGGWLIFRIGKEWGNPSLGRTAALLFLTFSGILFYFSLLAEIDLVYALIAFSGILVIFYFGQRNQHWLVFLFSYLFCAIGVLTKGLPSFAFTAISLLVYYTDRRQFHQLLRLPHFAGIGLLSIILAGYAWKYSRYNNPVFLLETLVGESSERTLAGHSPTEFIIHLLQFPLEWVLDLLPGGLLLVLWLRRDWKALLFERNPLIRFSAMMLLANILVYWTAPGTRMRYVYPLYPFAAILLAWAWQHRQEAAIWTLAVFRTGTRLFLLLAALLCLALPFIPDLTFLPWRYALSIGGLSFFGWAFWLGSRKDSALLPILFLALAIGRIIFDLSVLPQRAFAGESKSNKDLAEKIAARTGQASVYYYGQAKVLSYTTTFYLDKVRKKPVVLQDQLQRGQFYLMPATLAGPKDSILLQTIYQDTTKVLIKKN